MSRDRGILLSRQDEFEAIEKLAGRRVMVVVRGKSGAGKTALLEEVRRSWQDRGVKTIHIRFSADGPDRDQFGLQAVVAAFRSGFNEFGDSHMAAALAAVCRVSAPEACLSQRSGPSLFAELTRLFGSLERNAPSAVFFDDLHAAPDSALAVAAARHAGCTVVAASREDGAVAPTLINAFADKAIDLGALPGRRIDELISAAAGEPLDQAVAPALRSALGPLCGNPGDVLSVFDTLRRNGRLTPVHGVLCLTDPAAPIALPPGHALVRLVAETAEPGPQLVALVASAERFRVDDLLTLAEAIGWEPAACGRAIDQFVAAGVLACDSQEVLSVTCTALATAVLDLVGSPQVRILHQVFAEHLLHGEGAASHDRALVADHIALAGPKLSPSAVVVPLLCDEAARVLPADALTAARWYCAVLAHCRPHHPGWVPGLTSSLVRLLVRVGRYDWLGEVVAESVAAGVPVTQRYELAVAAAMAALHTGTPVSPAVYGTLANDPASRAPLAFAAHWFGGQDAMRLDEFIAAFRAFRLDAPAEPGPTRDEMEIAAGRHDLVALFGFLLGDEYGAPGSGPLALYRRIITGYHRGEWAAVLSAIRSLERSGVPCTPVHHKARLFAAEILTCRGEFTLAASWLAEVREVCPFPAMWGWVETGLLSRNGQLHEAIEAGWQTYARAAAAAERGNVVGLHWLLVRLALLEHEAGNQDKLVELCTLARKWYARYGGRRLQMAELMLGGLAECDFASACAAVEVLREHDNQSELMRALVIASRVADEPRLWLHEAYEIARRLGGDLLRLGIKAKMREHGVTPPRQRSAAPKLSDVELRVIALIQQGLTNRQIAGAMRVSVKTVESYLTRLFTKTGCRSRLDLATASIEGRLTVSGYTRSGTA